MANVRKRGDSYQIRVFCVYNTKSKQIVRTRTWMPTADMSERQIVKFEEECEHGQIVTTKKFSEFAEIWFNDYAKLNLRKTTYVRVEYLIERTDNAIGHLRMDKITSRDIQKFINSLASEGVNERTGGGLSHKTNQLGHSNSNTTLGIYSHMFAEARTKTCDVITNVLDFSKNKSAV